MKFTGKNYRFKIHIVSFDLPFFFFFFNSNLETWYTFIDGCIQDNKLVNTAYTCNMHTMSHIPRMVKKMGPLRAYSCRPMERMIGKMKRLTNARMATGINSGNILERLALFQYLEDTGIVSLESSQQRPAYKDDSFAYHPSGQKEAPQLWDISKNAIDIRQTTNKVQGIPVAVFVEALKSYKKRLNLEGTTIAQEMVFPAKRLWADNQVICSSIYTSSNKNIKRSTEYVMFESRHLE